VIGALSVIKRAKQVGYTRHPWLVALLERRSTMIAAIALANKIARVAWAMMVRDEKFEPSRLLPAWEQRTRGNTFPLTRLERAVIE